MTLTTNQRIRRLTRASSDGVCHVIVENDEQDEVYYDAVCHAMLGRLPFQPTYISSTLWYDGIPDAAHVYWNYILDPVASPWRCVLKDVEVHREAGYPIGFTVKINNTSSQVLGNLCIASRMPVEHSANVSAYLRFMSEGFPPYLALYCAAHIKHVDNRFHRGPTTGWHFPFNPKYNINLLSLKDGTPCWRRGLLADKRHNYTPCEEVWSNGRDSDFFSDLSGTERYRGAFNELFRRTVSYTGEFKFKGMPQGTALITKLKEIYNGHFK